MLKDKLIRDGYWLFKFRGQFPLLLIALSVPAIFFNPILISTEIRSLFFIIGIIFICVGFVIRFTTVGMRAKFSSGRNRTHHHTSILEVNGWYSATRNPLYLANFLIWMGISIHIVNPYYSIILLLIFWIFIERIILSEESYLHEKFGEEYDSYCHKTNVFIPKFKNWKSSDKIFSVKTVLKNEYPGISATCLVVWIIHYLNRIKIQKDFTVNNYDLYLISAVFCFALLMKLIKSYTLFFKEFD